MKTKLFSLIAVAVFALLGTNNTNAQGLYHPGKIIGGAGFKYVCEIPWMEPDAQYIEPIRVVRVRSINNRFTGVAQRDGDGKVIPYITLHRPKSFDGDGGVFKVFHYSVNGLWNDADKQMDEKSMLMVYVYVDPLTGKIIDIEFLIDPTDDFAKIDPEKYHQVEVLLKESVTYSITPLGRNFNYIVDTFVYRASWFGQSVE